MPADRGATQRTGRPRGSTRTEIAAAARRVLRAHGYADTTVDMIAAEAGISSRTFFGYFPRKSDVVIELFSRSVENFAEELGKNATTLPPVRALANAAYAHVRTDDEREYAFWKSVMSDAPDLRAAWYMRTDRYVPAVVEMIGQRCGIPADSPLAHTMCRAIFVVADASLEFYMYRDSAREFREVFDEAIAPLIRGYESIIGELMMMPPEVDRPGG